MALPVLELAFFRWLMVYSQLPLERHLMHLPCIALRNDFIALTHNGLIHNEEEDFASSASSMLLVFFCII